MTVIFTVWIVFILSVEWVCESKDFYNVIMPLEDTKTLEFNQYQKSDKVSLLFMQILNI